MFKTVMIAAGALAMAGAANASVLWSQGYDGSGTLYASQNDTANFGNFATVYDDFTLSQTANLNQIDVTGGYFNPGPPGNIADFTLTIYADAGGIPGGAIASGVFGPNETLLSGNIDTYAFAFSPYQLGAGTYWVSLVPDMPFPPQWGWATSGAGTGNAYQCFFGTCGQIGGTNMAFDVLGTTVGVPEPATWGLMLVGFGGLGAALRSKRRKLAAAAAA